MDKEDFSESRVIYRKDFFKKNTILCLLVIGGISLFLRWSYYSPEVPLTSDALGYFFYAADTSIFGHLPQNYAPANNGWPAFLSLFFSIFQFEDTATFMHLQRVISITISVITIIPIFFLCNRFFEKKISLIGTAIFAFEPHLIQNSLFGITDPLYILLLSTTLVLFLDSNKKLVYTSFGLAALSSMVRSEGLFLFFAIAIMFFIIYRKDRLVIPKFIPALLIFSLILLPMSLYRIEVLGDDRIIGRVDSSLKFILQSPEDTKGNTGVLFIVKGIENFPKYLGWSLIPIFIFFIPFGSFLIFKNLNYRSITIIVSIVVMSIPAFSPTCAPHARASRTRRPRKCSAPTRRPSRARARSRTPAARP